MVARTFVCFFVIFFLTGCISFSDRVYDDGFQRQVYSIATVKNSKTYFGDKIPKRKKVSHTYYYPDSVLKLKETVFFRYDESYADYIEYDRETHYFKRIGVYIPPLDTIAVNTIDSISGTFSSFYRSPNPSVPPVMSVLAQSLVFIDSVQFRVIFPMRSSCCSSWQKVVDGKYSCKNDTLSFYIQDDSSLRIDTVNYACYQDSMARISDNKIFSEGFYRIKKE